MKSERLFLRFVASWLFSLLLALSTRTVAQTTNYKGYAIFLYSFTKYVHWPKSSLAGDFKITVVGNSKVTQELATIVQHKTVLGRKIIVSQVNTAQELTGAHLVYLSGCGAATSRNCCKSWPANRYWWLQSRTG